MQGEKEFDKELEKELFDEVSDFENNTIETDADEDVRELEASVNEGNEKLITLVSGVKLIIKKFTGRCRGIWTDEKEMEKGGLSKILAMSVVEVVDPGIYREATIKHLGREQRIYNPSDNTINWRYALTGDRFDLLLQIRIFSYGKFYDIEYTCPSRGCRREELISVDLSKLYRMLMIDEGKSGYLAGNLFDFRLPDSGRTVRYHLDTGLDEENLVRLNNNGEIKKTDFEILKIRKQVDKVEGVSNDKIFDFLCDDVSDNDLCALLDEIDRLNCGVDTAFEHVCSGCEKRMDIQLPFDKGLLSPQTGMKARRRERRKAMREE